MSFTTLTRLHSHDYHSPSYKCEIQECLPHGEGTYELPDRSVYRGTFSQGLFHGEGTLHFPNGDRYEGYFLHGQIESGKFYFADGLEYNESVDKWRYCTDGDRRFYIEQLQGIEPIAHSAPTSCVAYRRPHLPYGCFDVGDGYLFIDTIPNVAFGDQNRRRNTAIYEFETHEFLRETSSAEITWARAKCMVGDDATVIIPALQVEDKQFSGPL